jgi:CrcB protein
VRTLLRIGLIALGSALGGLARWAAALASAWLFGTTYPWGTFLINVAGSFFLGWFATVWGERLDGTPGMLLHPHDLRLLVAVGFRGAFTTFSTFEAEAHGLLRDGDGLAGMTYIFGSVFLGLLAFRGGVLLARWI